MNPQPKLPSDLLVSLGLSTFIAFDTETTGLDPKFERLIEIGAVRFKDGVEVDTFNSLIACPYSLPPEITQLTTITDEMLQRQPALDHVLKDFLKFCGSEPLLGHNVNFDASFLRAGLKTIRKGPWLDDRKLADTALLSRVLLPTIPSRGLGHLGRYFNIELGDRHRALGDARLTGRVFIHLLSYFNRMEIKTANLLRRLSDGLNHPSAWIFDAWSNYLMQTASVEGSFRPHLLPNLSDNVLGKLPVGVLHESDEVDADDSVQYEKVDPDSIKVFFGSESPLNKINPRFENRPEQMEMAEAVTRTFNNGGILAVEAGTGVGKSLAYLLPAIVWAQANQPRTERVIISTNTRNLQDQLFFKDLPELVDAIPANFSAVLLKGRSNYLCRRRWDSLVSDHPLRLNSGERQALLPLALWVEQTRTGDVSEVSAFGGEGSGAIWGRISSDAGACRGRRCRERLRCFHSRIRTAAAKAQVVVVNHALLLSDIAADHAPIGAYHVLVVDEAHHLERAACQHLGRELNFWMFQTWCNRLYAFEGIATGLLAQMLLGLGAVREQHPLLPGLQNSIQSAMLSISELKQSAEEFFDKFTVAVRSHLKSGEENYTQKLRLRDPEQFFVGLAESSQRFDTALQVSKKTLNLIIQTLGDISILVLPRGEDWKDELQQAHDEVLQQYDVFSFFRSPADENWVYWAELARKQEKPASLYAAPLNAGDILREQLFTPLRTAILTSATLTVSGRFHYFLRKIGLQRVENATSLQLGSPFDYPVQMLIGLPAFLPSPRSPQFESDLTTLTHRILKAAPRGTLALFTSHRFLREMGQALEKELGNRTLLVQGKAGSRDQLLRRFRDEAGSVLLGTDSFWEGIDVVGEALELLLVTKLPFEVPSEPLVEARCERLKKEGKDPFMYYTVPEAIIRLRQGIGRLIRSKTDRGAALIFDTRLVSTRYGEAFVNSLPVPIKIFQTEEEMVEQLGNFFKS
ncbi:MAG: exonuclease domain-containing protein [bacterium]|nr:exonuclease domain-containing protein [bacterium]